MLIRRSVPVFLVGVFFFGLFGLVLPVSAEDTCECYCNIEGSGATKVPDESTRVTAGRCQELCREGGYSVTTCASKPSQKPQYNVMCFTSKECTAQGGITTATGIGTPTQPGECKSGMYYCYPDPKTRKEVTLQVAIGDLTVTGDLGEYISVVYKWMLGVGTTIAIVFVMVAGLRWSLGGASAEQIGKAKKTITSAITGLILLLSTYLIVFTVNPYLVRLQVPAFPMIKLISLVGEDSCGYLKGFWGTLPYLVKHGAPYDSPYAAGQSQEGQGYELSNYTNYESCGSVADVVKANNGTTVADDMTCTFDYCPNAGERCFVAGSTAKCAACKNIFPGTFPEPSERTCGSLTRHSVVSGKVNDARYCMFVDDPDLMLATGLAETAVSGGLCASIEFSCGGIKTCEDYEVNFLENDILLKVAVLGRYLQIYQEPLEKICTEDICEVGSKTGKVCVFEEDLVFNDCVSK